MQKLLQELLFLARGKQNDTVACRKPVSPDTLLLNAFESFSLLADEKQISMTVELPEAEIPLCICEEKKIYQVLGILLHNAISYTQSGGQIKLSLSFTSKEVSFHVADTGCGIPPSERAQIFERFYRAEHSHNDKNHFGLGLCIADSIVKEHKGSIQITDNLPIGTVFTVSLPMQKGGVH